jgi:hypothetical protein
MQPSEYKNKFAISQSALKDWKNMSPKQWYNRWILGKRDKTSSPAMDFGNLLDTIIFSEKLFDKRFIVSKVAKVSDKVALITRAVFDEINTLNSNATLINEGKADKSVMELFPDAGTTKIPMKEVSLMSNIDIIQKISIANEYYQNTPDRAVKEILKAGTAFFEFLKQVGNKTVITSDQLELARSLKKILLEDPITRGFFIPKKDCEVIFQVPIFIDFELTGVDGMDFIALKGILDIVHINHKRKEIREVDLKFTNDAFLFDMSIRKFDYPLQHSVYDYLLNEWKLVFEKGKWAEYTVMNPLNVVIDDKDKIPYLYNYTATDLDVKRVGIENTKIIGWETTLHDIAWHIATNFWERPRQHYLNGFISVEIFRK